MRYPFFFLMLVLISGNAWAWRTGQCNGECGDFLRTISGGNTGILALEIALFVFLVLYLFIKVMEKWHK
ncbi:hypothetical protein [Pseudoalteromonas ardens]|uniref:Uncharacterized protein n=1 Tax=Pseudoalteromonas rubra TaxID=43658 RepID=A0A0L0EUA1_9GAMM|nr:hypothetical protein [Pseudoalteromonas sp. R96]KNC67453.1 hypothetical protein AC626_10600 [Pseudoalteromonas rubra]MDK1312773.1 hypothetical protein [Pseudoalteromonas sp. R96]